MVIQQNHSVLLLILIILLLINNNKDSFHLNMNFNFIGQGAQFNIDMRGINPSKKRNTSAYINYTNKMAAIYNKTVQSYIAAPITKQQRLNDAKLTDNDTTAITIPVNYPKKETVGKIASFNTNINDNNFGLCLLGCGQIINKYSFTSHLIECVKDLNIIGENIQCQNEAHAQNIYEYELNGKCPNCPRYFDCHLYAHILTCLGIQHIDKKCNNFPIYPIHINRDQIIVLCTDLYNKYNYYGNGYIEIYKQIDIIFDIFNITETRLSGAIVIESRYNYNNTFNINPSNQYYTQLKPPCAPLNIRETPIDRDYTFHRKINSGTFGSVFLATQIGGKSNHFYAVKIIKPSDKLMSEVKAMHYLNHINIVSLVGCYTNIIQSKPRVCIVMDKFACDGVAFINSKMQLNMEAPHMVWYIITEIVNGLLYLHNNGVIHRDIKPGNFTLTLGGGVKIIDLGECWNNAVRCAISIQYPKSDVGTRFYLAPEINGKTIYKTAVDVYAFGMLIYELLYPIQFHNVDTYEQIQKVLKKEIKPNWKYNNIIDQRLLNAMIAYNPNHRPSMAQIRDALLHTSNHNINNNYNKATNNGKKTCSILYMNAVIKNIYCNNFAEDAAAFEDRVTRNCTKERDKINFVDIANDYKRIFKFKSENKLNKKLAQGLEKLKSKFFNVFK